MPDTTSESDSNLSSSDITITLGEENGGYEVTGFHGNTHDEENEVVKTNGDFVKISLGHELKEPALNYANNHTTMVPTVTSGGVEGSTLVFKDVCVTLSKKLILKNVYGMAKVGQTLAIMGPSGAGKSTLLNTLAGRIPASSGLILLNGEPVSRHMRRKISYVQQQDVFYPNLTLRESLTFTTLLRLPDGMPKKLRLRRMYEIVEALELNKCLDTKIGGLFITGLSGGEKKRASIACELLTNPRILILDEPTSGLDSAIAFNLMSTLSRYASLSHKTVVTTIHQPSSQIFHMFTNVLLLTDGEIAYFGPGNKIIDFFSNLGFHCAPHYNPADFILDQVKSTPENVKKVIEGAKELRKLDTWPEELKALDTAPNLSESKSRGRKILTSISEGRPAGKDKSHPGNRTSFSAEDPTSEVDVDRYVVEDAKWQTGFLTQYTTLTRRGFVEAKDRFFSKLNFGQIIFIALVAGCYWWQTDRSEFRAKDRMGILFFTIVQYGFIPIHEGVFLIYDDSGVFVRERSQGVIRLSAFFAALNTVEFPVMFLKITIYGIIIYWMSELMPAAGNFFAFLGILYLAAYTSQSMGMFIGAVVLNKAFVVAVANTMMISFLVISGFYNITVPSWFYWSRYLSYITYALSAMGRVEFEYGKNLTCNPANTTTFPQYCGEGLNETRRLGIPGEAFLDQQNMNATPLYADLLILAGLIIVFRAATYIALRFTQVKT